MACGKCAERQKLRAAQRAAREAKAAENARVAAEAEKNKS